MMSNLKKKKKPLIKDLVSRNASELKEMKSHKSLRRWAIDHEISSAVGFASYKKALLSIGICYDTLRKKSFKPPPSPTHSVELYFAASSLKNRFTIVANNEGEKMPIWCSFFKEKDYTEDQKKALVNAAKKAIFLASTLVRDDRRIKLYLIGSVKDLCSGSVGARSLELYGNRVGIAIEVLYVCEEDNLAVPFLSFEKELPHYSFAAKKIIVKPI